MQDDLIDVKDEAMTQAVLPVSSPRGGLEPKLLRMLRQGYGLADFKADAMAGLTVAIVALPLSMALAIASGATPSQGLLTAVIAGFLISAFGGSRYQIGGPTGAFVVVVYGVIAHHGYDGLILATCMAGLMLIALALTGAGSWIRYIPDPVIVGFTTGIAVIIASGEVADFFGLKVKAPAELVGKAQALWGARATFQWQALALGLAAMALILVLRRFRPKWPGLLIAAGLASLAAALLHLPAETIGDRFGSISGGLPLPHLPRFDYDKIRAVLPSAFTIAFLAAIESLLSATVADSMTGGRHKPNAELMGQGLANLASGLFGGLPATGAIARTATNIRAGGRSPVAGMMHAVFVLIFMLVAGRLMAFAPMTALAAILLLVAWNMAELPRFVALAKGPMGDRVILILTFLLTIFADLTMAIAVGVVLASLRFMHRMAQTVHVDSGEEIDQREGLPPGVEVFAFDGPLFFGAASMLDEALGNTGTRPVAVILRLEHCPMIDATAGRLLADFIARLLADGSRVILCGLHDAKALGGVVGKAETAANFEAAKALL